MVWRVSRSVSVPEKTLEHWASQYVAYRYRSKAALWWPSRGEDIDVRWLPARPGKAVQIELKTTTVAGVGFHDVLIDLGQLWEYRQRRLGRQPFYALPTPDWRGQLSAAAINSGLPVTELAFARSGPGWWFVDWMVVVTAGQVAAVLHNQLMAHGCAARGKKERLVRYDLTRSASRPAVTWGAGTTPPVTIRWRDFWMTLEQCGQADWPQLIMLPVGLLGPRRRIPRSHVLDLLREAASEAAREWERDGVAVLEPDREGNYEVAVTPDDQPRQQGDVDDGVEDHRQLIFLDAAALHRD
jgi:hypothetical protein